MKKKKEDKLNFTANDFKKLVDDSVHDFKNNFNGSIEAFELEKKIKIPGNVVWQLKARIINHLFAAHYGQAINTVYKNLNKQVEV